MPQNNPEALPDAITVLREFATELPSWLRRHPAELRRRFPWDEFFGSRVVYYPGAGCDGHAVKMFGMAHAACCFVYADYGRTVLDVKNELSGPHGLRGYKPIMIRVVRVQELRPDVVRPGDPGFLAYSRDRDERRAVVAVLQREADRSDEHGPERLAFVYALAEGFALFETLWGHGCAPGPYGILLQDHGFGGQLPGLTFGGSDSPMFLAANQARTLPTWLLVGENTTPWPGYYPVSAPTEPAGFGYKRRVLHR